MIFAKTATDDRTTMSYDVEAHLIDTHRSRIQTKIAQCHITKTTAIKLRRHSNTVDAPDLSGLKQDYNGVSCSETGRSVMLYNITECSVMLCNRIECHVV
ncbi:hypothetical protein Tcan_17809 [Toxocara canis]|uniref:Uncharacterized protein n=1 Tax=Toxocara canis TaxID=6265 RepID=A0A0B2VWM8_TOXCA|nr:hypothetical protein Tcan_17809 [Toxocara canis]